MQSSNFRPRFAPYPSSQGGPVYHHQRPLGPPPLRPLKGMDVHVLLDRSHAHNEGGLRLHHPVQLHTDSSYGMNQGSGLGGHHHSSMQQPHGLSYAMMAPALPSPPIYAPNSYIPRQDSQSTLDDESYTPSKSTKGGSSKIYPCSWETCDKSFARRSDLSRHERIHSGNRPHTCDWEGCEKAFIQRSALTVHMRVHTGEKPHRCLSCAKTFSDSSSLARHRRIHTGKRPYKCEFANCQKTFTRRTTLTRHQAQHSGTPEEAAAEVQNALSTSGPMIQPTPRPHANYESTSGGSSDSPENRMLSNSPSAELLPMVPGMQRQTSGYGYPLQQIPGLPAHMRGVQQRNDYQQTMPRSISPLNGLASLQQYSSAPQPRTVTSHPSFAGPPPQPIEPPANGTASGGASPHMSAHISAPAWSTSGSGALPPPTSIDGWPGSASPYPDIGFNHQQYSNHQLYYANGVGARPMSTEPKDYGLQVHQSHLPQHMGGDQKDYDLQAHSTHSHMSYPAQWEQMNSMGPHSTVGSTPRQYAS